MSSYLVRGIRKGLWGFEDKQDCYQQSWLLRKRRIPSGGIRKSDGQRCAEQEAAYTRPSTSGKGGGTMLSYHSVVTTPHPPSKCTPSKYRTGFYSVDKTETFSPADSLSYSTEGLLREEKEEPGYIGVSKKPGSQNIRRLLLIKRKPDIAS